MQHTQLEVIAGALVQALDCRQSMTPLRRALVQLLAQGQPITPVQLAVALHLPLDEVIAALRELPELEYDEHGNIVGKGVTLLPTAHQFQVDHRTLFTWCALDALSLPVLLRLSARVVSTCPVTGGLIRLTVTPEQILGLDPASAVVSLVIPEASACRNDVRGTFCNHSHFFRSRDTAAKWQETHPDALIFSVEDAYQIGKFVAHPRSQDVEG